MSVSSKAPRRRAGRPATVTLPPRVRERIGAALPLAAAVASVVLLAVVIAVASIDWWRPLDTYRVDYGAVLRAPSWAQPFGTDDLGRDMLTWSLHGLRTSLLISAIAALVAVGIGTTLGLLAGGLGGWVDAVVMRLVDVFASQSHFLFGLLILVLVRPVLGPAAAIMLAVALTHWVVTARIVRSELLSLRSRPFVRAAVDMGASRAQVIARHLLPNVLPLAGLAFVLTVPHAIFHETGYSFLGLGMPLDQPSLGRVLGLGQQNLLTGGWWVSLFPGLLIFVTAAAIGTIGEWLRDRNDPRLRAELEL